MEQRERGDERDGEAGGDAAVIVATPEEDECTAEADEARADCVAPYPEEEPEPRGHPAADRTCEVEKGEGDEHTRDEEHDPPHVVRVATESFSDPLPQHRQRRSALRCAPFALG